MRKFRIGSILFINLLMIGWYIKVMLGDTDAGWFLAFFFLFIIAYNISYGIIFHGLKLLVQLAGKDQYITEIIFLFLYWGPILYAGSFTIKKLLTS